MTNLQTVPSKNPPAEGARTEMGNFFQMPSRGIGGNLSDADFDSFMGDRNPSDLAEELREEQEAAKKRKKPVDAGLGTPLAQVDSSPVESAEILLTQKPNPVAQELDNSQNISARTTEESKSPDKSAPDKQDAIKEQEQLLSSEVDAKTYYDLRGMESAPVDSEMIASASLDAIESPAQQVREPSITTINRLTAFASLERTAVAPVTNSGSSSESGIGNAASGNAFTSPISKPLPQSPSAQASALFKSLGPELDKFKQTGGSQIQLDLPVGEDESVRIKLSIRGGEIRSTFITESPELRDALQKAWPEFSQNSRDRGFRMGDPAFQQSFQENSSNLGQNNRRQSDSSTRETGELFATAGIRKPLAKANTSSKSNSTALWA